MKVTFHFVSYCFWQWPCPVGPPWAGDILGRFSGASCQVAGGPGLDNASPGVSSPGRAEAVWVSGSPGDEGLA